MWISHILRDGRPINMRHQVKLHLIGWQNLRAPAGIDGTRVVIAIVGHVRQEMDDILKYASIDEDVISSLHLRVGVDYYQPTR